MRKTILDESKEGKSAVKYDETKFAKIFERGKFG